MRKYVDPRNINRIKTTRENEIKYAYSTEILW